RGWSLCGAPWLQPVAIGGKSVVRENGGNKRKPLPSAATVACDVPWLSRASAVSCHPLREFPSLRRRGSTLTWLVSARLFLRAIRARVAAAAGTCLAEHGRNDTHGFPSRGPSAAVLEARLPQVPEVVDDEAP